MKVPCVPPLPGVTVKYVIDATLDAVPSGQTAQQAAYEGNMHFSQYLAAKTLSVDVWDGESLLQVSYFEKDLKLPKQILKALKKPQAYV
jgi:nephrocystin-4